MHERVGDLEKNNHGVKDRAYTKNQSLNHATAEREREKERERHAHLLHKNDAE